MADSKNDEAGWLVVKIVAVVWGGLSLITWMNTGHLQLNFWDAKKPAATAPVSAYTPSGCNRNYSGCVPNSPTDLDCADVLGPVMVRGVDVYRLDGDHDGVGCE
jgi:hypothetical protein